MEITKLEAYDLEYSTNIFRHDIFGMGTEIGKGVWVMHSSHSSEECTYLEVVDMATGERIRVTFEKGAEE